MASLQTRLHNKNLRGSMNTIYLVVLTYISMLSIGVIPTYLVAEPLPEKARMPISYDVRLSTYTYDFDVNFFSFNSQNQDLEMAYMFLKGKKGKPVVTLMHGKNFNADYWTPTARYLHNQGYSVLIPDQLGFGKSSKPKSYQYSFSVMAFNTQALMASLNIDQSIVLGHSMGGMLASRFALMYPQHTRSLILLNPIGLENYAKYTKYKDTNFFYANELKKTAEKITAYQKKNYYAGQWSDKYAALNNFAIGQIHGPDKQHVAWVNALTYDMIFTQPVIHDLVDVQVPLRLIIGTRDRTGPGRNWKKDNVSYDLGRYDRLGKTLVKHIPGALLFELDDLGHLPQLEDFKRFTHELDKALVLP